MLSINSIRIAKVTQVHGYAAHKNVIIHEMRFTALTVKTILFVENDGPNRHSSGLSSSGGSMADIPNCKSQ